MKFWQMLAWTEVDQMMDLAVFAEELGFDAVINSDHAIYPENLTVPYPYSPDGKPTMNPDWSYPDCWATIAAMGAVTKRIRLSTSVYILPLRNVFEVAKATGTLSLLSEGRFILGTGLGWMKDEFDIYGVPFKTRARRNDEMVEILRKFWAGGMVEHHGEFYDFPRVQIAPAPERQVPIFLGGNTPPALKRAAYLGDGWISAGNAPDEIPGTIAELQRLRKQAGRDHLPFETVILLDTPPNLDTFKRLQDSGMDAGVVRPFYYTLGERSSLDDKKRVMEKFANDFIVHLSN